MPLDFTTENYQKETQNLKIIGGAIVSGSFQKFDQKYLIHALNKLRQTHFGVANIPINIQTEELNKLNKINVVAVRFNLKRGGSENLEIWYRCISCLL